MNDSVQSVTRHSNLHKCISILLSLLMVMSCFGGFSFTANAAEVVANGTFSGYTTTWSLDSDGVLTIGGTGAMPNYVATTSIPYYPYRTDVKRIIIEDGVTSIGNYCFTILTNVTSVTLGNHIESIGDCAFRNLKNWTGDLVIPDSVISVGEFAFNSCTGLTGNLILGNGLQHIERNAFEMNKFTGTLTMPNGLKTIGFGAFSRCSGFTGSLVIPDSVTSIGKRAFERCSGFDGTLTLSSSLQTIEFGTFSGCSGFTGSLVIPDSVSVIDGSAFYQFGKSASTHGELVISDSVTSIGSSAFASSGFSGSLFIPDSVTTIGSSAFEFCANFKGTLRLSNQLSKIEDKTFAGCTGFSESLIIPNSVLTIGNNAFNSFGKSSTTHGELVIPDSVTSIGSSAFISCGLSGNLFIPDSVTTIGSSAFENCTNFKGTLRLSNQLSKIEDKTFSGCSGFTGSLIIPNSVTNIGNSTFYGCSGFTGSLIIPNSVTKIGNSAFYGCYRFNGTLEIQNTETSIGTDAFHGAARGSSTTFTGKLEDCTIYHFFENYKEDDDDYQFISIVEGARTAPTLTKDGRQVYYINCADSTHSTRLLTVNEPLTYIRVDSISVAPASVELLVGETKQLTASVLPENASNTNVTYSSSNPLVATISADGLITAVGIGTTNITISATDGTGIPATVIVTVSNLHTHNPGEPVHENDVRDDDNGTYTFEMNTYCQDDGTLLGTEVVMLDRTHAVEAVVGSDGHNEYFTDDKGTDDTSDDVIYVWNATEEKYEPGAIIPTHVHNPGEPIHENDVRDNDNGTYTFELNTYCQDDNELVDSETVVLEITPAVEATVGHDGHLEYFTDKKGNEDPADDIIYVWDEAEEEYILGTIVPTHVHNPGEPIHENDVRDDTNGTYTFELNTYCQDESPEIPLFSELVTLTIVPAAEAVPGTDGNIEYFVDDKDTDDTSDDDIYIWDDENDRYVPFNGDVTTHVHNPSEPVHENDVRDDDNGTYTFELNTYCQDDGTLLGTEVVTLDRTPAVEAAVGSDGHNEYFTDGKGTDDTSDDVIYVWNATEEKYESGAVIPTHVHNPGEPVHENDVRDNDNGIYTFELNTYCQDDNELVDSETVTLTIVPEVPAQPGTDGNIEYFVDNKGNDDPTDDDIYVWDEFEEEYILGTIVPTHVHNPGQPIHENDVRDDNNGTFTFELNTYCQDDNELLNSETVVLEISPAVEATVGHDGHLEYFTDKKGNEDPADDIIYVWDEFEEEYILGTIVPTHVHNPGEPIHENDVRDDTNGTYTFELNTYCQDESPEIPLFSELVTLTIVPASEAVPGTDGNIEYFVDDKGNNDPTDDDIYIWDDENDRYVPFDGDVTTHIHNPGEPVHENDIRDDDNGTYAFELNTYCQDDSTLLGTEVVMLDRTPAVEAVVGTDGHNEYFTDNKGTDDTSDDVIYVWNATEEKYELGDVIPTHVHNPGEPVHENDVRDNDNGTYTFELNTYCQDDNELVDSETVTLTIVPEVPAQPGTDGNIEYFVDDKGTDDTSDDDIYVWDDDADKYVPFNGDVMTHVHNPGEPVHENDVRDNDARTYTFELNRYCTVDSEFVDGETVVLTLVPAVEAQPGTDGNIEYFVDNKGTDDTSDDDIYVWNDDADKYVPFNGDVTTHVHNPGEPRHENDVRDDDAGTYTFELNRYCTVDGEFVDGKTVVLTLVPAVEAQPGTDGNIEYFVDDKGTDDTSDDDIYVWDDDADKYVPFDGDVTTHEHNPGTPAQENANPDTTNPGFDMVTRCEEDGEILNSEHVDLTYVPEKAPDDTADGYETYYIDNNGNVYDYDEDSELFVPSEIHYIHNPSEPVHENDKHNDTTGEYSFDLATYCTNDGTELDRETIVLTKHDAKDPSQDFDGNIEYYEDKDGNKYLWDEDEGKYVPTDDTSIIVPRTPVTSLIATADRTDLDMDGIQTATITVEINPNDASDKRVTYVSSNPSVVLVDNNGRVLAVGGGTATVTVSSKSNPEVKDTITFNVVQDTRRLDGPNSGNIGETGTISMYTDTAKPYHVKYFTSNNSLLEIDEDTGAYAVRGAGNVTITARVYFDNGTTKDVTKSFRCVDPDAGKYRCKMCDTYEAMKDAPIVGIFYTIVHFFVHLAHSIGYAT